MNLPLNIIETGNKEEKNSKYTCICKNTPDGNSSYRDKNGVWKHIKSLKKEEYNTNYALKVSESKKERRNNAYKGAGMFLSIISKINTEVPNTLKIVKINQFKPCVKSLKGEVKLTTK